MIELVEFSHNKLIMMSKIQPVVTRYEKHHLDGKNVRHTAQTT